jgi:Ni/Fe-hydrogenase subunit HybB-like protein
MEGASGVSYVPRWTEIVVTLAIVAAGFTIFHLAVKYLPIFEDARTETEPLSARPKVIALKAAAD